MNENMLCTKTHEYVLEKDDLFEVGITDFAIEQLGDIVFIELPEVDSEFSKNEVFATVESVKAASEIYMPISGKVVEINEAIVDSPELLNDETYADKWCYKDGKLDRTSIDTTYDDYIVEI